MHCLTVNLIVQGWPCLVIGGGPIALGKARRLIEAGAQVTLVAPELAEPLTGSEWLQRQAEVSDLDGKRLVIVATDDPQVNRVFWEEADRRGILAAAADDLTHAHFYMPAVLRRGELEVTVSTGGTCPAFTVWLRDQLALVVDDAHGQALSWFAQLRDRWRHWSMKERNHHMKQLLALDFVPFFRDGRVQSWEATVAEQLEENERRIMC